MRLILVGFGTVGQSFAQLINERAADLRQRYDIALQVVGVATGSRGILYHPDGLDHDALLNATSQGKGWTFADYPEHDGLMRNFTDAEALIRAADADVVVEMSPTNLSDAQPARRYFEAALQTGKHIVTSNKGPIALDFPHLQTMAREAGKRIRFEATVMAGSPAIATGMDLLAGATVQEVRGIINGTTNYILTQMENGMSYADALADAQAKGYAETDPSADVDGWDAAGKLLIIAAAIFGKTLSLDDLTVTGIRQITQDDIAAATAAGERYKLIARATPQGGAVQVMRLPQSDSLASVMGATNAITYQTDILESVTVIGPGAGGRETAFGLLADILAIGRTHNA